MKKLLLTSDGFTNRNIGHKFIELVDKKLAEVQVLFIPTASRSDHELLYVKKSEDELVSVGIPQTNITWLDIENVAGVGEIDSYDVIYVCGGNTFYWLCRNTP